MFDIQPDPASGIAPTVTISGLDMFFGKAVKGTVNGMNGGNVLNNGGTLTLSEDQISNGETIGGEGAGVASVSGTLTITHSLIEDNLSFASGSVGGSVGGVDNIAARDLSAQLTIDNSTIVSNTAAAGGGGVSAKCQACGSSTVTITNSTIANNDGGTATTNAGGLVAGANSTGGANSTISIKNSIVSGNTVGSGTTASNCAVSSLGAINSGGHNIETATDCGFKQSGDHQNTNPGFLTGGVTDNGGNSDTIALAATSPAVDAIPAGSAGCKGTTDQRDFARPQGTACDIGAYELTQAVEGAQFTGVIGSVQSKTTPTIDWGDGTAQSNGTVDPTTGQVTGTHTYAEAGIYHGLIHFVNSDGRASTLPFDFKVTDALLAATATPVSAVAGSSFSGTVATFTDANPLSQASDFSATISWGDGTASTAGTVSTNTGGGFKVTGTHTYANAGSFTTSITINDVGGSSASASGTATVNPPPPTVTSVSPSAGPTAGGTSVTITGTNFTGATVVKFGATNATAFTVNSATSITAAAPAGSAGTVDVTVTTAGGTSATSANDNYRYAAVPTVTAVSPSAGPTAGGTSVTITGTAFTNASAVKFGTTTATSFTINSATSITAAAPAGAAGTVDITVTTAGGTSATGAADQFTFAAPPTVTNINPSAGPTGGGTSVTITGTNFTGATAVKFGATNATTFTVNSATQITATAPAGSAGTVDITVATPGGTSATSANDRYTYAGTPTVTGLAPDAGPLGGGTTVTITGTNLSLANAVKFGAANASGFTVVSATKITATAPAGAAGAVDVTVTTPGGTSAAGANDRYTYTDGPVVTSITPSAGPTGGGTTVTISGTKLVGATAVRFGTTDATTFNVVSTNEVTATAPAHTAATVDVVVTTVGGTSPTGVSDEYTFAAAPTVTSITPVFGPSLGGTPVTIVGTNLAGATVEFGNTPVSPDTNTATLITATSPAGSGSVPVKVTTPGGSDSSHQFTFVPPPTVTGVSPSSGPAAGGTSVTITGTDFTGASAVHFGASQATGVSVVNTTQITATSPAGAGIADVTVTTPSGTSATSAADQFTYQAAKIPPPSSPVVLTGAPSVHGSSGAALEGSVNPQGLATTAHYEYGLDSKFRASGPVYDQSTASQNVGSDFSSHTVVASLSGLVPNALYHVRLVATNSAGTSFGPDATFTTKEDPPPPPPRLGGSFNAEPVKGLVFVEINGKFIPITEVRQIPNGAIINALHGTVELITSAGGNTSATAARAAKTKSKKPTTKATTQKGTFGGAVFKVTQAHSGLVTLLLVEGASFAGAPTYASCQTHSGKATVAALSKKTLQLLKGSDNHGKFRTKGRYAAATVRGTVWSTADRCDGTLTHVTRGTVVVSDLVLHKTITVHAGHSYLALARPPKHK